MQEFPGENISRNSKIVNLLGQVLVANGKYDEAEVLILRALRMQEEAFGKTSEDTLGTALY